MTTQVDRRWMRMSNQRHDLRWAARRPTGAALRRALVALGVVLIGVVVLVLDGHDLSWLAGLVAGVGAGAWIALVRAARGSPTNRAQATLGGARAERRTEAAVRPLLRSGWRFLHDVRGSDRTFDHVAVGHGGVILLQSLDPQGTVMMRDGEPWVERRSDPEAEPEVLRIRPRAVTDAVAFRDDVQRLTGRRMWVQAAVVIWSDFPAGVVTDGRCVYIHGSRLADWLTRRPHQLDLSETDDVFATVALLNETGGRLPLPVAV
jgi:hypothetical protein